MPPTDTSMIETAVEAELGKNENCLIYTTETDPAILRRLDRMIEMLVRIHEAMRK